jgi:drug/metabolite transporter (DMT)-like permease
VCGGIGLALFYRALALGTMSVVSPVTGVVSAAVPVSVGILLGERPSLAAALGIALAIVAVSMFGGGSGDTGSPLRGLAPAIAAGAGFGGFFVLLSEAHHGAGLWPIVSARSAACLLYIVAAGVRGGSLRVHRAALAITIAAGIGDVMANAFFLAASRHGDLAIVGVIGALYPASTLVLARVVLNERLVFHQRLALAVATGAVVLIAVA